MGVRSVMIPSKSSPPKHGWESSPALTPKYTGACPPQKQTKVGVGETPLTPDAGWGIVSSPPICTPPFHVYRCVPPSPRKWGSGLSLSRGGGGSPAPYGSGECYHPLPPLTLPPTYKCVSLFPPKGGGVVGVGVPPPPPSLPPYPSGGEGGVIIPSHLQPQSQCDVSGGER